MDKWGKVLMVFTLMWGLAASVYVFVWPDSHEIDGYLVALLAAGIVSMFYAKGD